LPDSANVFNDVIRHVEKEPMAIEIVPQRSESGEPLDMRALWRLGGWGAGAAVALLLVAFVSTSDRGNQRLGLAFAPAELPVRPVTTVTVAPSQSDTEIKRLAAQLHALAADRDRASARIASLERQLSDLTGSINRLAEIPPLRSSTPATPAPTSAPRTPHPAPKAPMTVASTVAPTTPSTPKAATVASTVAASSIISPLAMPGMGPVAAWPQPPKQADTTEQETVATVEEPSADQVPMPPERVAAAAPATTEPAQPGFGIALAGASSLEVARMQWTAIKANFGSMLATLEPRTVTERRGGATHYRLVAGPLPTYASASRLCARIVAAYAICQPIKFYGDPL
jgi:hypothetical protein